MADYFLTSAAGTHSPIVADCPGRLPTYDLKQQAQAVVARVAGVRCIDNQIEVLRPRSEATPVPDHVRSPQVRSQGQYSWDKSALTGVATFSLAWDVHRRYLDLCCTLV